MKYLRVLLQITDEKTGENKKFLITTDNPDYMDYDIEAVSYNTFDEIILTDPKFIPDSPINNYIKSLGVGQLKCFFDSANTTLDITYYDSENHRTNKHDFSIIVTAVKILSFIQKVDC